MVDLKSLDFKEVLLTGFSVVGAVLIVALLILFGKFIHNRPLRCSSGLLLALFVTEHFNILLHQLLQSFCEILSSKTDNFPGNPAIVQINKLALILPIISVLTY
jgi:hypothetical protein